MRDLAQFGDGSEAFDDEVSASTQQQNTVDPIEVEDSARNTPSEVSLPD